MPWRVFITPAAERILNKLPDAVRGFVATEFPPIVRQNPMIGGQLKGNLSWLRSYHFSVNGQPYRVAYSVNHKESKIVIRYADHRGGFYDRLRRIVGL